MKKILYIPLDERPCNYSFPAELAEGTDFNIVRPDLSIMGNKKTPGDVERLWTWLFKEAKDADGAILSLDTLLYGGIIPSRLHSFSIEECENRLTGLRKLKEINPKLVTFAFNLIIDVYKRQAYYIPVVTSMVAVSIIWGWLLSQNGVINYLLMSVGIINQKISWLTNYDTALWVLMFVTMWKGLGYYMMIYLAGLQAIPMDLVEAARIDGANRWQVIRKITIPLLKPYVFFCSLISLMGAIRVFDEVFVLTSGGPGNTTLTSSLYIYQQGFQKFNFGYSSALGLIVSVIIMVLSVLVFLFNRKGGVNPY